MSRADQGPGGPAQASQLSELVACERELAVRLAETEARASRMVEEARSTAAAAEAELEASLEDEAEGVRAGIRAETQRSVRELKAQAEERVAHFEAVSEEEVGRLASVAFRLLIGGEVES